MFSSGNLIVDPSYQRRSIWNEKDKVRLIETILLHFVVPELFFWKASTDPETGSSITHIVDGQQRITAIYSFINNEFKLKSQYLMNDQIREQYGDMFFKDLPPTPVRTNFWNYEMMVVEIDSNASRSDIIEMFNRLNLTDYNLNSQEKRNSRSGEFASLATEISENPFWSNYHLFSNSDIKRMKDVEFCATIILLYKNGIVDQTDQSILNKAYEKYQTNYIDAEKDKNAILDAIDIISSCFISSPSLKFLRKKSQLYSLFSVVFYSKREDIVLNQSCIDNFNIFVELYLKFSNAKDLSSEIKEKEKIIYDWLKRYKMASSEGLNKHANRMIRFNVLRDFLFNLSDDLKMSEKELLTILNNNQTSGSQIEDPDDF